MKEVKAFIRANRLTKVVKGLRSNDFKSITVTEVEGLGRFSKPGARPSFRFPITHSKMAKLELVCNDEDVEEIVKVIHEHGSTGGKGDGIIYVSNVDQIFKVNTGMASEHEL